MASAARRQIIGGGGAARPAHCSMHGNCNQARRNDDRVIYLDNFERNQSWTSLAPFNMARYIQIVSLFRNDIVRELHVESQPKSSF